MQVLVWFLPVCVAVWRVFFVGANCPVRSSDSRLVVGVLCMTRKRQDRTRVLGGGQSVVVG